jgi:hypothetical protein
MRFGLPALALTFATLMTAGAAPASAGVLTGTFHQGSGGAKVSGLTRARLAIFVGEGLSTTSISVGLTFRNATGTATAEDEVGTLGAAMECGPKLGTCAIDDNGELGTYGRVDLTFTATRPLTTQTLRCASTNAVLGTMVTRKGVVTGTLRLATKSAKLGTIRNTGPERRVPVSIPFVVKRFTYNGAGCPVEPSSCAERVHVRQNDLAIQVSRAYTGTKRGTAYFTRDLPSSVPGVERSVTVTAEGTGSAALTVQTKATLATASVGMTTSSPFVTGSLGMTGSSDLFTVSDFGCDATERSGTLVGTLTWRTPGRAKTIKAVSSPATITRLLGTVAS